MTMKTSATAALNRFEASIKKSVNRIATIAVSAMKPSTAPYHICHIPRPQMTNTSVKAMIPPAAGCLPLIVAPASHAISSPRPRTIASSEQTTMIHGRSPGAYGVSVARISALRASERLSRGRWAGGDCVSRIGGRASRARAGSETDRSGARGSGTGGAVDRGVGDALPGGGVARRPRLRLRGRARSVGSSAIARVWQDAGSRRATVARVTPDELIDRWQDAWSDKDPAAFAEICAPGVGYEDPLSGGLLSGVDAIAAHAGRLWAGFPDARLEKTGERLVGGDLIAAPCKVLGTHRAPLDGLPATNRFLVVHCIFYCEITGGRLLRVRGFYDVYEAAVQLGVLPGRGTVGEKALLVLRGFGFRAGRGA